MKASNCLMFMAEVTFVKNVFPQRLNQIKKLQFFF